MNGLRCMSRNVWPPCLVVILGCLPSIARADTGAPLVFALPVLVVVLTPLVLIEAALYRVGLRVPFGRLVRASAAANIVSTLAGLPVALLLIAIEDRAGVYWAQHGAASPALRAWHGVPAVVLIFWLPLLLLSVLIEFHVARRSLRTEQRRAVLVAVWRANLVTYGLMLAWMVLAAVL